MAARCLEKVPAVGAGVSFKRFEITVDKLFVIDTIGFR